MNPLVRHRHHKEKICLVRSHTGKVFNSYYGTGTVICEWGTFEGLEGKMVSGEGVFDVRFVRDSKVRSINADTLMLI